MLFSFGTDDKAQEWRFNLSHPYLKSDLDSLEKGDGMQFYLRKETGSLAGSYGSSPKQEKNCRTGALGCLARTATTFIRLSWSMAQIAPPTITMYSLDNR